MDRFTSDLHFWHDKVLLYNNRPFTNIVSMERAFIYQWNLEVNPEDTVYVLGDLTLKGPTKLQRLIDLLNMLNGKIKVIYGNHDNHNLLKLVQESGQVPNFEVLGHLVEIKSTDSAGVKYDITLCHYPMRVWNKSHHGSLMLYGHTHGCLSGIGRQMDVGVDAKFKTHQKFSPYSIDEVVHLIGNIQISSRLDLF